MSNVRTHTLESFDTVNMFCHHVSGLRAEETVTMRLEVDSSTLHRHRGPEVGDEAAPHGDGLDWFTEHPMC